MTSASRSPFALAVFGAGRMGQTHIENLLADSRAVIKYVVASSQTSLDRLKTACPALSDRRHECQFLTADHEDAVFNDSGVQAVVISSPTARHEQQILKALKAEKAVFCEKPVASDSKSVERCYALAEAKDLPLFCAFQRRFDPSFAQLREAVRVGKIGKVHLIKSCSRDPCLPSEAYLKTSSGFFMDSTVHDFDMLCWIANEYPVSIYAVAHANYPIVSAVNDWDTIAVTVRFPSGLIGIIDQSRSATYGYDQRLEVHGEKGMLEVGNLRESLVSHSTAHGAQSARTASSFLIRYADAYRQEMKEFLNILEGSQACMVKAQDVTVGVRLTELAAESVKTRQAIQLH